MPLRDNTEEINKFKKCLLYTTLYIIEAKLLVESIPYSTAVANQINEFFLWNLSAFNLKVFLQDFVISAVLFSLLIFIFNYLMLRDLYPKERFLKRKHIAYLYIVNIVVVYSSLYLTIAFFYAQAYGIFLPKWLLHLRNSLSMQDYYFANREAFITVCHEYLSIISLLFIITLYCSSKIVKHVFIPYLRKELKKQTDKSVIKESNIKGIFDKDFNYNRAELYFKSYIYYYALNSFLYFIIVSFLIVKNSLYPEFLVLNYLDVLFIPFLIYFIIFIHLPRRLWIRIKNRYEFKISNYITRKQLKKSVNFYCIYLSLFLSSIVTIYFTKLYDFLENYANIVVTQNFRVFQLLIAYFICGRIESWVEELLMFFAAVMIDEI